MVAVTKQEILQADHFMVPGSREKGKELGSMLVLVSFAVKRHHDHSNNYFFKKHLIGAGLHFRGFSLLS